jgi:hypothetical protein
MITQFGLYPRFYVKRKDLLFPLIEKYSGKTLNNRSHGQVLTLYISLLRSSVGFREEVDALITKYEGKLFSAKEKKELAQSGNEFKSAAGIFGTIVSGIGNILNISSANAQAKAASDQAFYEVVLNEQKKSDTTKILIVSGIALAFIGVGIFFVIKMKK